MFINFRGSPARDPRAHSLSASYAVKLDAASLGRMKVNTTAADQEGSGEEGGRGGGAEPPLPPILRARFERLDDGRQAPPRTARRPP